MGNQDPYLKKRKLLSGISLGVILLLLTLVTVFVWRWLVSFSEDSFRAYIRSFGALGWLVLLGLQILQVFVALIPGEILESAAGYAFGPFFGTLICYVGLVIATTAVFCLTRRFGVGLVEVFISREKINQLRFLNTERKQKLLIFLVFFIPGTPKDLLTYFAGLTELSLGSFLWLSLVARIPSVLSSTLGGHMLGQGRYWGAALIYAITALFSLAGMLLYKRLTQRKNAKKAQTRP